MRLPMACGITFVCISFEAYSFRYALMWWLLFVPLGPHICKSSTSRCNTTCNILKQHSKAIEDIVTRVRLFRAQAIRHVIIRFHLSFSQASSTSCHALSFHWIESDTWHFTLAPLQIELSNSSHCALASVQIESTTSQPSLTVIEPGCSRLLPSSSRNSWVAAYRLAEHTYAYKDRGRRRWRGGGGHEYQSVLWGKCDDCWGHCSSVVSILFGHTGPKWGA